MGGWGREGDLGIKRTRRKPYVCRIRKWKMTMKNRRVFNVKIQMNNECILV